MGTEDIYLRNIRANISYDQDNTEVDISESVINAKVDEIACSGNVLKMGEFCKNSIEFEYNPSLLENPSIFWNNKKLNVSLQYEYIYPSESTFPSSERYMYKTISLGKFYVNADDVETSNNGSTYVVTAYDLPKKMSDIYDTESSPTDSIEILHKIESDTGMVFANIDIISSFKIESVPEGTTYAGMVAYIAGYEGYNARVNSSGEIEFYWYFDANIDTSKLYTIKREVQYLNGFSIKETLASINAVMSGKADTESENGSSKYTAGSGEALTYDNPYITQEKVTEIYNRIKGFTYCIGDLKWRADQNIRAGDLVRVETKPGEYVLFPVMEYSMTLDGGLVGNSISYTYVVQNNVMGSTPSDKKLSNVYKNLTEAFKKQTGIIKMNEKAGFYRLLIDDETGFPYGWVIADSEEITETTKGWMWTQGGLMHSSDGFRTADKIAFTQDGQLSAEMISANSITLGNLNVDALNKIEGAYDHADSGDANTLKSANSYADTSAQNAVNAQTQDDIFNKLTNNGQTQGIYLQNGKLYINADYLQSGTIKGINIEGATITGGEINTPKQIQFINDGNVSKIFASKASINGGPEEPALLMYSSNFDFLGTSDDPLNSFSVSSKYFSLFMIDTGVYITHDKDRIARSNISLTDTWAYLLSEGNGIYAYANGQVEITSNGAMYINSKSDIYENAKDSSGNVKSRLLLYSNGSAYLDSIGNNIYIRSRTSENDANKAFLDLLSNGQVWLCGESQSTIKAKGNSYVESVGNNVYVRSRNSDDTSTNAQLVLQNDGKAFLIGNGNGNTFINGYPAVRINGTYHDIFFQWNGASLIATVDVTQVWSTSDRRLKDQIDTISDDYIDAIGSAEIKQFIFTDDIYDKSIKHFGVIAQDLREALESKGINPEEIAVNNHFDRDGEEYYGIDKEEFLMARIAYDEKKIKMLEERIEKLEKLILKES